MTTRPLTVLTVLSVLLAGLTGCSLPRPAFLGTWSLVHRIDVQQGNVITQDMLAQLEVGIDKKKVSFIMGTPAIIDTFHGNRWDYIYTFQKGRHLPKRRHIILFFEDNKLVSVSGDVLPATGPLAIDTRQDQSVDVPLIKAGLVTRMVEKMPFQGPPPGTRKPPADDEDSKLMVPPPTAPISEASAEGDGPKDPPATEATPAVAVAPSVAVPAAPVHKKNFFRRLLDNEDADREKADEDEDGDHQPD